MKKMLFVKKYIAYPTMVTKKSAALSSATQRTMPREWRKVENVDPYLLWLPSMYMQDTA